MSANGDAPAAAAAAPAAEAAAAPAAAPAAAAAADGAAAAPAAPAAAAPAAPAAAAKSDVSASLYVGDLEPSVSEAQLYEVFSNVGPVVSIRVCRDLVTRRSLGYAYVNYNNPQDAGKAIELLNFTEVNGKSMRIMFSHRDPSQRRSGVGNIFIKNLDKAIDNKALHDTFAQFGTIVSCKIKTDDQGVSLGQAYVQYDTAEAAEQAIEKVNGMQLLDKQVSVAHFVRKSDRKKANENNYTNIFVKNLDEAWDEDKLKEIFTGYGEITSISVAKDDEGKCRGFGFVAFADSSDAVRAVEELNEKEVDGKELFVGRHQKKSERVAELKAKFEAERKEKYEKLQGVNLYLKNIDETIDEDKLRTLFEEFGTITSARVLRDTTGNSKGSGFIAFSSPEEATKAVTEMNGKMVNSKPLYVALAQRKEERQARLKAQFAQRIAQGGAMPSVPPMFPPPMGAQGMFYGQPPGLMPGMGYPQQMMVRPGMAPYQGMPMMGAPQPMPRGGRGGGRGRGRGRGMGRGGYPGNYGGPRDPMGMPMGVPPAMMPQPPVMPPDVAAGAPAPGAAPAAPGAPAPQGLGLAQVLASSTPDHQRMILGEALYPQVEELQPTHAGKITGMLLEMDQSEVLHLIESHSALVSKVDEAMAVLQQAATPDAAAAEGTA